MRRPTRLLVVLAAVTAFGVVSTGIGDVGSVARAASETPPDVVVLKNGGMARGTISEKIPGDHVTLVLPSGETRRFDMAEVSYAGPASERPARSPSSDAPSEPSEGYEGEEPSDDAAEVPEGEAPVTYESQPEGIYLHRGGKQVCKGPCETTMEPGTYNMGLSREGKRVISWPRPVRVPEEGVTIEGAYSSKQGLRIAGRIIWPVLSAVGVVTAVFGGTTPFCDATASGFGTTDAECDPNWGQVAAGVAMFSVGNTVGPIFSFQSDSVRIRTRSR